MGRLALRTAALLALGALGLAGVELAVRGLGIAPSLTPSWGGNVPDPVLPYRRAPGSVLRGRSASGEFDFEYRHNALGFRGANPAMPKPPGTLRLVALGDSFTYGEGVAEDELYHAVLGRRLAERLAPRPVDVVNLGLPRFFTGAERLVLEEEGLALEPDVVLVGFLPNDVVDTELGLDWIRISPEGFARSPAAERLGDAGTWLFLHSHAARILLRRWADWQAARAHPVAWDDVFRAGGLHEDDWLAVERELERIRQLADGRGARLVLVSIPQAPPWEERHGYPDARLGAWSRARGVDFVPVLERMRRHPDPASLYWPRDGHCNAAGQALIADAVEAVVWPRLEGARRGDGE